MTHHFDSQELRLLVESLLNETITPEQHARLEEILQSNPQAQDAYFAQIDLHLALRRSISIRNGGDLSDAVQPPPTHTAGQPHLRKWIALGISLTVAALLIVAAGLWNAEPPAQMIAPNMEPPQAPDHSAPQQVILSQVADAELVREIVPEVFSPMDMNRQYALAKGMMELSFPSGAKTIIQAPAIFEITSLKRLDLKIGICSVHAPQEAAGFEVVTPKGRIVDLGTRFSVTVDDVGSSEVQVTEGAAEVYSNRGSAKLATLLEGEATLLESDQSALEQVPFDPTNLVKALPDRVVTYEATQRPDETGVRDLKSVTVQRGGVSQIYSAEELIGIDVIHFRTCNNFGNALTDRDLPEDLTDLLSKDNSLTTGLVNFNRDAKAGLQPLDDFTQFRERPGLAIQFHRPVINGPGPDVVLFEVQSIVYPPEGDHFRVSPIENGPGLHSHDVLKFDITLNSANARQVNAFSVVRLSSAAHCIEDLSSVQKSKGLPLTLPFSAIAVGIDLSDLGYDDNAEVSGLFIEDLNDGKTVCIDPVFIAGLPTPDSDKSPNP